MAVGADNASNLAKRKPVLVSVALPRCPACGSTARGKVNKVRRRPYTGGTLDAQPTTAVVTRQTTCAACGLRRVERFYENDHTR
jgi:hypothetical protein